MKSSLCVSAAAGLLLPAAWALAQGTQTLRRANELTLAGLRPGRDALAAAFKQYSQRYVSGDAAAADIKEWRDPCTGRALRLELNDRSMIQAITVSSLVPQDAKCEDQRFGTLAVQNWVTGRGLRLGDPQDRVIQLYGEPDSSGPSVSGDHELEFLYYAFDWAGVGVPQVMEIHCARESGRVVEMTLTFSSL
jgi:hypothetical protein